MSGRDRQRGVILILFAGVTGLFLLMALFILQTARAQIQRSDAVACGAEARACAASGLEYAAARLSADPFPFHGPDAASRGDDWTERQGSGGSGQGSNNPSFARGESWTDASAMPDGIDNNGDPDGAIDEAGEIDRIFVPGEAFADLDGDGRHSAWSGRVRGGSGAFDLRFALKVESPDGKVALNAGEKPPLPDPCRQGLVNVLNNLGSLPFGPGLVNGRPAGGYRSWDEVQAVLASLGCPSAEIAAFCGHLTLEPCLPRGEGGRCEPQGGTVPRYSPVNGWCASAAVLEALWRNLQTPTPVGSIRPPGQPRVAVVFGDFPAEPDGWDEISPLSGKRFLDATLFPSPPYTRSQPIRIFQPESLRLSETLRVFRQKRAGGWHAFRKLLHDRAGKIFKEDFDAIAAATPSSADVMKWTWAAAKANLAFQNVAVDAYPGDARSLHPSSTWTTWGIDANPDLEGVQPAPGVSSGGGTATLGLTLAAPSRFEAVSRGASAAGGDIALSGTFRIGDVLELSSQEDFECLGGTRQLASIGLSFEGVPSPAVRKDGAAGYRPNVVTLPEWDRSFGTPPGTSRYPLIHGAVGPAPAEIGSRGSALLYWPFTQGFIDPGVVPPSWNELWSVHQPAPAPPWEPAPCPLPPYRFSPSGPRPYGFVGTASPCQMPGMVPLMTPIWGGQTYNSVRDFSVEAWIGVNASMVIDNVSGGYGKVTLSTKRGSRNSGRTWGTELTVECIWATWDSVSGTGGSMARKARSWLVKDPSTGSVPWARHAVLTVKRVPSGMAVPAYKALFKLYVDGSGLSEDGPMEMLFDGMEPYPPLTSSIPSEYGEMICGRDKVLTFVGVDEVRLYNTALEGDPGVPARYVPAGLFLSPLYVLDVPGRPTMAQWTGAMPEGTSIDVKVRGYWDAFGGNQAKEVPLADPARPVDLVSLGMPDGIRSFRYVAELRSGVLAEPPLLESIWLLLRRRGQALRWTGWRCR